MVSQPAFTRFANSRLSYLPTDVTTLADSPDGDALWKLMQDHDVDETPGLIFLNPKSGEVLHLHTGFEEGLTSEVFVAGLLGKF